MDESLMQQYLQSLASNDITSIDLQGNSIGVEGVKALGVALEKNTSLTSIDLGRNSIGNEGAKALGVALEKNVSLTSIKLDNNDIGDEGAKALGAALEKNTTLTSIHLGHNCIGDEGAKALGAALEKNTSLTYIHLHGNSIDDEGAKALGAALEKNTTLTSIHLGHNCIGNEGAKALGAALEKNTSLTYMNFHNNSIEVKSAKALGVALPRNRQLHDSLFEAVRSGNAISVRNLCRSPGGIDAVTLSSEGLTVFHVALDRNHWECMLALFCYPNCRPILVQTWGLKYGRKCALDELVEKLGPSPLHHRIYDHLVQLFPTRFRKTLNNVQSFNVFSATATAILVFQEATQALQQHSTANGDRNQLMSAAQKSHDAIVAWGKDQVVQEVDQMTKLEESVAFGTSLDIEQRDKARRVAVGLLGKSISECVQLIHLLMGEKSLIDTLPQILHAAPRQRARKNIAEGEKNLRESHENLNTVMSSLRECFIQEVDASLKGRQDAWHSSALHIEVLSAAKRLQAAAKEVEDAIRGEEATFAPTVKARLQVVNQELHHAQSWMVWAQSEADRLKKVLEAGCNKTASETAAKEAIQKFKRCQELLRRATFDLESGEGSEEEVKTTQANLQRQRAVFEESQRRLLTIRNSGYPEIRCASASPQDCALPQVPLITMDQLQSLGPLGDVVGEGGFAQVFRIDLAGTGPVAFKKLRGGGSQEAIMREARPMWGLRHPNLVQLLLVCVEPRSMGLVLEWVDGPVLSDVLHKRKIQLPRERKLAILKDVLSGLSYMHQLRHTHLDVKSDNVLLCGDQGAAKLSDFGTAKEQLMTVMDTEVAMTLSHSAPEILSLPRKVSAAADVWSIGMLIYELETNSIPFAGMSLLQVAKAFDGGGPLPAPPPEAPLKALFDRCVIVQPAKRASCKELLKMVEQQLHRQCIICMDDKPLTNGVGCNGAKCEFVCFGCMPALMESVLQSRQQIQADGGVVCSCGGSYPLHEMHQRLHGDLFKRWIERREEQRSIAMEQQLRIEKGKLRLEAQSRDVAIAGTKECPFCYMRWGEPINCHHVTCHQNLHGCGGQWCWECRCDWNRVRVEGNTAHALDCRYHTNNL